MPDPFVLLAPAATSRVRVLGGLCRAVSCCELPVALCVMGRVMSGVWVLYLFS